MGLIVGLSMLDAVVFLSVALKLLRTKLATAREIIKDRIVRKTIPEPRISRRPLTNQRDSITQMPSLPESENVQDGDFEVLPRIMSRDHKNFVRFVQQIIASYTVPKQNTMIR